MSEQEWYPKTKLGRMVFNGEITSIDDIFKLNKKIKEPEIVDFLLPNLESEVADITLVQRQTDAGEVSRFRVVVVVGNRSGYIGVGKGVAREIPTAIKKATQNAKLNLQLVIRGCGSWACGCGGQLHSLPFTVEGASGSVRVKIIPAPRGVGLVTGEKAKTVLKLAGISDAWVKTKGNTRTTLNFVVATYKALTQTTKVITKEDWRIKL